MITDNLEVSNLRAEVVDLAESVRFWGRRAESAEKECERLRAALKPFAEIGQRLYDANQRSDQSVLIGASARFLKLEPLTGQNFVDAHVATQQKWAEG